MLVLLAIPVIAAVAITHRFIQAVAPSNLLVRSVRSAAPRWAIAAALLGIAIALLVTMHGVAIALSAGALIVLSPLLAAIAVAVRLTDGGPVFYRQVRVGCRGEPFTLWKFRSMVPNAETLSHSLVDHVVQHFPGLGCHSEAARAE